MASIQVTSLWSLIITILLLPNCITSLDYWFIGNNVSIEWDVEKIESPNVNVSLCIDDSNQDNPCWWMVKSVNVHSPTTISVIRLETITPSLNLTVSVISTVISIQNVPNNGTLNLTFSDFNGSTVQRLEVPQNATAHFQVSVDSENGSGAQLEATVISPFNATTFRALQSILQTAYVIGGAFSDQKRVLDVDPPIDLLVQRQLVGGDIEVVGALIGDVAVSTDYHMNYTVKANVSLIGGHGLDYNDSNALYVRYSNISALALNGSGL